jgi:hypothetical protein
MHFDVIVEAKTPYEKTIEYGKRYLESIHQGEQKMTQEECVFCHIQEAPKQVEWEISSKGFFVQKMEGCP